MYRTPLLLIAVTLLFSAVSPAQTFDSGSDGSDGALLLDTPGTIDFDPASFTPPLDPDGDGVYHFTTITVAAGVTVRFRGDILGSKPVVWLASGDVTIDGDLDLDGGDGHNGGELPVASIPGAGGYYGGFGASPLAGSREGQGPGAAGGTSATFGGGGGAGHFGTGSTGGNSGGSGGPAYGSVFLIPIFGGSGGAGGGSSNPNSTRGGGGGAGGGALLIASSTSIIIDGILSAEGGNGGLGSNGLAGGGAGSGGSIRLMAETIGGAGTLSVAGGSGVDQGASASRGRVRFEAFEHQFAGSTDSNTRFVTPGLVFSPAQPTVRVTSVAGTPVPVSPASSFAPADLTINESGEVTLEIAAANIPLGTVVQLSMVSETLEKVNFTSTPLAGTFEASTATAAVTIPHGFSRFSVQASWTP